MIHNLQIEVSVCDAKKTLPIKVSVVSEPLLSRIKPGSSGNNWQFSCSPCSVPGDNFVGERFLGGGRHSLVGPGFGSSDISFHRMTAPELPEYYFQS